jgi:integrase
MDLEGVKMFLSKRPNGIYYIYYDDTDGIRKSISTKAKHKKDAYQFLSNFKEIIKEENKKITHPIDLMSFRFKFLKHSEAVHTPKTTKTFVTTFKYLLAFIGNAQLLEITDKKIRAFVDYRIKNPSLYQARKDLINISSCFNWAVQEKYVVSNPCATIKQIKVPPKLPVFFSKDEFTKLGDTITNKEFKAMVLIAVNTGLREMELLTLRWDQIRFDEKILILDNRTHITKGKKIRTVPLNNTVLAVLRELKINKISGQLVFKLEGVTNREKYVQNNFRKYVKITAVNPKLNFHSLRHTFASWLVQAGVSIYEVSKLLGHSDIKTTQIYAHLREDDLRRSVELLE